MLSPLNQEHLSKHGIDYTYWRRGGDSDGALAVMLHSLIPLPAHPFHLLFFLFFFPKIHSTYMSYMHA